MGRVSLSEYLMREELKDIFDIFQDIDFFRGIEKENYYFMGRPDMRPTIKLLDEKLMRMIKGYEERWSRKLSKSIIRRAISS